MTRKPAWIIALALVVAPAIAFKATPAQAQLEQQQPAQQQIGQHDIESFMTQNTVAITEINLNKVDLQRTGRWAQQLAADIDANGDDRQRAMARLGRQFGQFEIWVGNLKQAGAEKVYIISNVRDGRHMPVVVVPNVAEQQVETVKTLLTPVHQPAEIQDRLEATRIRDSVVLAPQQLVAELQQPQPLRQEAREIKQALEQVEGAAIKVAFRADSEGRQVTREMGAALRDEQLEGVNWVAMGIDFREQEDRGFKMVMKAEDSDKADTLASRWNDKLKEAAEDDDARPAAARLAEHREALEAKTEDDRVIVTLTNEQANEFLKDALVPLMKDHKRERQQQN